MSDKKTKMSSKDFIARGILQISDRIRKKGGKFVKRIKKGIALSVLLLTTLTSQVFAENTNSLAEAPADNLTTFEMPSSPNEIQEETEKTEFLEVKEASTRGREMYIDNSYIKIPVGAQDEHIEYEIINQLEVRDRDTWAALSKKDYTVTVESYHINTDIYSSVGETIVTVESKDYPTIKSESVELNIIRKDTLVMGLDRSSLNGENREAANFSLLSSSEYQVSKLYIASGEDPNNDVLDPSIGNELVYKIEIFRRESFTNINSEDSGDIVFEARGNEKKQDVIKRWKTPELKEGDVVRSWHRNPSYNRYESYGASTVSSTTTDGFAYFMVSQNYSLVEFAWDHIRPNERMIPQTATDTFLDRTIAQSFSGSRMDSVEFDNMLVYPNRTKVGKTTATVEISVTPVPGYRVTQVQEVPFEVVASTLTADFIEDSTLPVGTKLELLEPKEIVSAVYESGKKQDVNDYEISFYDSKSDIMEFDSLTVGNRIESIVQITSKKNPNQWYLDIVETDFNWGNTLANYNATGKTPLDASISLLHGNNESPYLSANRGTKLSSRIGNNLKVELFEASDTTGQKFSLEAIEGKLAEDYRENLQNEIDDVADLAYGDVLVYSAQNTDILSARNEKLVSEAKGFDQAYYELTTDGYYLLRLNQFKKNGSVVKLAVNEDVDSITEKLEKTLVPPSDLENDREFKYEVDETSVDVTKPATNQMAKLNVYEKLATQDKQGKDQMFMTTYEVPYVVEENLELKLKTKTVPVGTNKNDINPEGFIEGIYKSGVKQNSADYTITADTSKLDTHILGDNKVVVTATSKQSSSSKVSDSGTLTVNWGNSLVSKSENGATIDSSISLLSGGTTPHLVANKGTGLSPNMISSRPDAIVYRNSTEQPLITSKSENNQTATALMTKRNTDFSSKNLQYGDVLGYEVHKYSASTENLNGGNTWVSRNEVLLKETEGYDQAYYEMTTDGYHLLHLNQFSVSNKIPLFNLNDEKEVTGIQAKDLMVLPDNIPNKNDYRFEYDIDTSTSGKKEGKIKVYEKLVSGKEFMTTYPLTYQVNYQVTEKYLDDSGKELKAETKVNFEKSTELAPAGSITYSDKLYIYEGWLPSNKTPGKDKPTPGNPPTATNTVTYQYIYKKADSMISMTIPTGLMFSTNTNNGKVSSKNYEIKNNSEEVGTKITLEEFKKEKATVKLLKATDKDPTKIEDKARFNLMIDQKTAIESLTENTKNQEITTLTPGELTTIGLSGTYFGDMTKVNTAEYKMVFKFEATEK